MAYSDKEIIKKIEAETRNEKLIPTVLSSKRSAFLNKGRLGGGIDCQDCETVIIDTNNAVKFANPFTGASTSITHPEFSAGELAKFGNKFWIKTDVANVPDTIKEFQIGPNCSITHVRDISLGPYTSSTGAGMCAKDANTLIIGSISIQNTSGSWMYSTISEVDISGSTAVITPLFQTGQVAGDIVYIPSSNTIAATISFTNQGVQAIHFDMSGTILGQASFSGSNPFSMFS